MFANKTHLQQSELANYCRNGQYGHLKGVKIKNISYYRTLVFNNVFDSLSTVYPLTKKLLKKKRWLALVERFFASQPLKSPQIWRMPQELLNYVEVFESNLIVEYPFLPELIYFEWKELEVFMMPDKKKVKNRKPQRVYLNPEIELMRFEYPVHSKKASRITSEDKGLYFVSMHRHPESGSVEFTNLSIPFVEVLEKMSKNPLTNVQIENVLRKYADERTVAVALNQFLTAGFDAKLFY